MANKSIQWTCRGLKANFNELLLLLTGLCPSIICLQETFLKPSDNLNIRGYNMYNHIYQSGDRASGGSSIVVIYFLYTFCSVIVICHFNIELTEAGVMHEAGYVDSIWST